MKNKNFSKLEANEDSKFIFEVLNYFQICKIGQLTFLKFIGCGWKLFSNFQEYNKFKKKGGKGKKWIINYLA